MPYGQGNLIEASDYNQIREDVGEVFNDRNENIFPYTLPASGFGYGVAHVSSTVASGDPVAATDWENLFEEIYRCATHQGTTTGNVPEPSDSPFSGTGLNVGDLIEAYDGSSGLLQLVSDIRSNRLTFSPGFFSVSTGGTMLTNSRTSAWSDTIEHEFSVTLSDIDNFRYFFNSGGNIIFSASRTGGTTNTQNTDWTNGLDAMSDVMFGATETTTNGDGTAYSIGLYDLTTNDQLIFEKDIIAGDVYYGGSDSIEIYARYDAAFESNPILYFTVRMVPNSTQNDGNTLDGTLTSYIDKREAVTYVPPPESLVSGGFTTLTSLSTGG